MNDPMNPPQHQPELTSAARLYRFAQRPSYLIKVICQMLLGIGIAIGLIAKVYMFVLTDYQCQADSMTLGNKIRCENTLAVMAYGLALFAGFELAYRMFVEGTHGAIDPLLIGVSSALLLVVSSLSLESATWQVALLLTSLTFAIVALLFCRERFTFGAPGQKSIRPTNQAGNQSAATELQHNDYR